MAVIQTIISVGKALEKLEPCTVMVMLNGVVTMENSIKISKYTAIWSSNSAFGYMSKRIEMAMSKRYLHPHVHGSITPKNLGMETTQMFINIWMDKGNVIYADNISQPLQRRKFYDCATTRIKQENIMLSKTSHSLKDK